MSLKQLVATAEVFRRSGKLAAAESVLNKALERFPESAEGQLCLGKLLLQKGEIERCVLHLRSSIELGGEFLDEAQGALGGVMLKLRNPEEARRCCEQVRARHREICNFILNDHSGPR